MGYTSATAASGHLSSVRRHLNAGITVASAGILALGLVAAPPGIRGVEREIPGLQLASFVLPLPVPQVEFLQKFISEHAEAIARIAPAGAADVPAEGAASPVTFKSASVPAVDSQQMNNAALTATADAFVAPILDPTIFPVLLLFGPLIVGALFVNLLNPFNWILLPYNLIGIAGFFLGIPFPVITPFSATAMTTAPELTSDLPMPVTSATAREADAPPATDFKMPDVSPRAASTDKTTESQHVTNEPTTGTDEVSTKTARDLTKTVAAEGESTEQPAVGDPESAGDASEPTKPAVRPATPRPVVRDSLGADKKTFDLSHRGNGSRSTTEEPADHKAASAGSSSADSSSTDSASTGGSSDKDSGGSE